jgi:tetratricopeptide (TPR) repeat protein
VLWSVRDLRLVAFLKLRSLSMSHLAFHGEKFIQKGNIREIIYFGYWKLLASRKRYLHEEAMFELRITEENLEIYKDGAGFKTYPRSGKEACFLGELTWHHLHRQSQTEPAFVSYKQLMSISPFAQYLESTKKTVMSGVWSNIFEFHNHLESRGDKTKGEWAWAAHTQLHCDRAMLARWLGKKLRYFEAVLATARALLQMGANSQVLVLLDADDSPEAQILQAHAHMNLEQFADADQLLKNLPELDSITILAKARLAWHQHNSDEAVALAVSILNENDTYIRGHAYLIIGAVELEKQNPEMALDNFYKAQVQFSELGQWFFLAQTHFNLAKAYTAQSDLENAKKWLELVYFPKVEPNSELVVQLQLLQQELEQLPLDKLEAPTQTQQIQVCLKKIDIALKRQQPALAHAEREELVRMHDQILAAIQTADQWLEES